jgi:transposase
MPAKPAPQQVSSLSEWRSTVEAMLTKELGPQAIHDRLRLEQAEFRGSLGSVKRLVQRIRRERGVLPEDVAIPVDTEPGEVAQVDFGYAGKLWDPATRLPRKAWVFVMVLGYSRHQFLQSLELRLKQAHEDNRIRFTEPCSERGARVADCRA